MLIPKPLLPGDTVALVGVSGCIHEENIDECVQRAVARLEGLGFKVRLDPSCGKRYGYLAGTDQERADALMNAFADDEVDGIWCIKGGYGCIRMLDLIDWDMIRRHPKAFIGFSDITTLHTVLHERCGLCTFHGPMPKSSPMEPGATLDSLMHALAGVPDKEIRNLNGTPLTTVHSGIAEGQLVGGNLTLVTAGTGTAYDLDVKGKILFLEDVGERTYVIDRYLHQLYHAGKLTECAGIILGGFTDCVVEDPNCGLTLEEVLRDVFSKVNVPVLSGLQAGHMREMVTLPLGRRYRMDADKGSITLLDD